MGTADTDFNLIEPSALFGPRIYFTELSPDRTGKRIAFEPDFESIFIESW